MALLLILACGQEAAEQPQRAPTVIRTRAQLLAALNAFRKKGGAADLLQSDILERAAAGHAQEMMRLGYFGSFSPTPERRTPDDRLALEGWPEGRRFFEILGGGSAKDVYAQWTSKPDLAAALNDPTYVGAGLARAARASGEGGIWVLMLGAAE